MLVDWSVTGLWNCFIHFRLSFDLYSFDSFILLTKSGCASLKVFYSLSESGFRVAIWFQISSVNYIPRSSSVYFLRRCLYLSGIRAQAARSSSSCSVVNLVFMSWTSPSNFVGSYSIPRTPPIIAYMACFSASARVGSSWFRLVSLSNSSWYFSWASYSYFIYPRYMNPLCLHQGVVPSVWGPSTCLKTAWRNMFSLPLYFESFVCNSFTWFFSPSILLLFSLSFSFYSEDLF